MCKSLLKRLPELQSLEIALLVDRRWEDHVRPENRHNSHDLEFFDDTNEDFFALRSIFKGKTEKYIELDCQLYCLRHLTDDAGHWHLMESLTRASNLITYKGTPDDGPYAWQGLKLEVLWSSTWEYQTALEEGFNETYGRFRKPS